MNSIIRIVGAVLVPVVLAVSLMFINAVQGLVGSLDSFGVWPALAGCAFVSYFLSGWLKAWVAPVLYLVLGTLAYLSIGIFGLDQPTSVLAGGVYALMGVGMVVCAKKSVSLRGIGALQFPAPVLFVSLIIMEALLIQFVWTADSIANLWYLGACFLSSLVLAFVLRLILPSGARFKMAVGCMQPAAVPARIESITTPAMKKGKAAPVRTAKKAAGVAAKAPSIAPVPEQPAFPVGVNPDISVLDMKLAGGEHCQEGARTRAKMLVETEWD